MSLAHAEDACPGKLFDYGTDGEEYVFWLREVPQITFRSSAGCNPFKDCTYEVTASGVEVDYRVAQNLNIRKICTAFRRTETFGANLGFEWADSVISFFAKMRVVEYRLNDSGTRFVIEVSQYFNGEGDEAWGTFDGDEASGGILPLGITSVEVFTSAER